MKAGDLVKRKPEWGEWVRYNPWMLTEKDIQIGIVTSVNYWDDEKQTPRDVTVLWQTGAETTWYYDIEVINENSR